MQGSQRLMNLVRVFHVNSPSMKKLVVFLYLREIIAQNQQKINMILRQSIIAGQMSKRVFFRKNFPLPFYDVFHLRKYVLGGFKGLAFFHQIESEVGYLPDSFSGYAVLVPYGFKSFFVGIFGQAVSLNNYFFSPVFKAGNKLSGNYFRLKS